MSILIPQSATTNKEHSKGKKYIPALMVQFPVPVTENNCNFIHHGELENDYFSIHQPDSSAYFRAMLPRYKVVNMAVGCYERCP